MFAAIDVGSNTVRLLLGMVFDGKVAPSRYYRAISRLAGDYTAAKGLAPAARTRTLAVLQDYADVCAAQGITQVRAIGTAAFRMAGNGPEFAAEIRAQTGIPLEIIDGGQEASLMVSGVLAALDPVPRTALVFDIGGGSTEFVLVKSGEPVWSVSLPLGVVRLTEDHQAPGSRRAAIREMFVDLEDRLQDVCRTAGIDPAGIRAVGTAGTVTTLAALDLEMTEYDWRRVNNYRISREQVAAWSARLLPLTAEEREDLPGMEQGRGDVIVAGIDITLATLTMLGTEELWVSDFGILEGLLIDMAGQA